MATKARLHWFWRGTIAALASITCCLVLVNGPCLRHPDHEAAVCGATLAGIGRALDVYAQWHNNCLPLDADTLVVTHYAQPTQFMCPNSQPAGDYESVIGAYSPDRPISPRLHEIMHSCYVYIFHQHAPADPADVLIYEKNGCHPRDGGHVLFGDYHVEWIEPYSKAEELVAKTKHRLATPILSPCQPSLTAPVVPALARPLSRAHDECWRQRVLLQVAA